MLLTVHVRVPSLLLLTLFLDLAKASAHFLNVPEFATHPVPLFVFEYAHIPDKAAITVEPATMKPDRSLFTVRRQILFMFSS